MKSYPASPVATTEAVVSAEYHEMSTLLFIVALACGIWFFFIVLVQAIGFTQLYVNCLEYSPELTPADTDTILQSRIHLSLPPSSLTMYHM
jgi:hypothetical protein